MISLKHNKKYIHWKINNPSKALLNFDSLFDDTNAHIDFVLRPYTVQAQIYLLIIHPRSSYPSQAKLPRSYTMTGDL